MAWVISGDVIATDFETRMVINGTTTYWTDNKSRAVVIMVNPYTGNEDRMTLQHPRPWWVIQHQMQMMAEVFHGMPILEIEHRPTRRDAECWKCGGRGGAFGKDDNWMDCPVCGDGAGS